MGASGTGPPRKACRVKGLCTERAGYVKLRRNVFEFSFLDKTSSEHLATTSSSLKSRNHDTTSNTHRARTDTEASACSATLSGRQRDIWGLRGAACLDRAEPPALLPLTFDHSSQATSTSLAHRPNDQILLLCALFHLRIPGLTSRCVRTCLVHRAKPPDQRPFLRVPVQLTAIRGNAQQKLDFRSRAG